MADLTGGTGTYGFVVQSSVSGTQLGYNIEPVNMFNRTGQDLFIGTFTIVK